MYLKATNRTRPNTKMQNTMGAKCFLPGGSRRYMSQRLFVCLSVCLSVFDAILHTLGLTLPYMCFVPMASSYGHKKICFLKIQFLILLECFPSNQNTSRTTNAVCCGVSFQFLIAPTRTLHFSPNVMRENFIMHFRQISREREILCSRQEIH